MCPKTLIIHELRSMLESPSCESPHPTHPLNVAELKPPKTSSLKPQKTSTPKPTNPKSQNPKRPPPTHKRKHNIKDPKPNPGGLHPAFHGPGKPKTPKDSHVGAFIITYTICFFGRVGFLIIIIVWPTPQPYSNYEGLRNYVY